LELTDIKGLSQADLAVRLGISLSGAKSRVQRAREKLKEAFLDCCHFEFDRFGRVIDYHANCPECAGDYPSRGCEDDQGQAD
jgi:RNA polymerase sigma-70 factor (ECF subfamily)